MNRLEISLKVVLLALALPAGSAAIAASTSNSETLVRAEMQGALERLADVGVFANGDSAGPIALSLPATRSVSLGLVLDGGGREGPTVLGTTPGGTAQRMGIAAGDVLLSINGTALAHSPLASVQLRTELDALPDNAALRLRVKRGSQEIDLSGRVLARYLPPVRMEIGDSSLVASTSGAALTSAASAIPAAAQAGCGRISVFHIAPRSEHLFQARVLALDGTIPGTANQQTYRVSAGTHTLLVAEDIESVELPVVYSRARNNGHEKSLSIDVKPGMTYLISARLNLDRRDRVASGEYWDPVVWKEIPEACH